MRKHSSAQTGVSGAAVILLSLLAAACGSPASAPSGGGPASTSSSSSSPLPAAATSASASEAGHGTEVAHYTVRVPVNDGIMIQAGGVPKLVSVNVADLDYGGGHVFGNGNARDGLSPISTKAPTFASCYASAQNQAWGHGGDPVAAGSSFCYMGSGVVAGITVLSYSGSASADSATLEVTIWK